MGSQMSLGSNEHVNSSGAGLQTSLPSSHTSSNPQGVGSRRHAQSRQRSTPLQYMPSSQSESSAHSLTTHPSVSSSQPAQGGSPAHGSCPATHMPSLHRSVPLQNRPSLHAASEVHSTGGGSSTHPGNVKLMIGRRTQTGGLNNAEMLWPLCIVASFPRRTSRIACRDARIPAHRSQQHKRADRILSITECPRAIQRKENPQIRHPRR